MCDTHTWLTAIGIRPIILYAKGKFTHLRCLGWYNQQKTRPTKISAQLSVPQLSVYRYNYKCLLGVHFPNTVRIYIINIYCTLRGRDQRLKCAIISIFYGAVLYLPNFRKIQHTSANIAHLGKYSTLGKNSFPSLFGLSCY